MLTVAGRRPADVPDGSVWRDLHFSPDHDAWTCPSSPGPGHLHEPRPDSLRRDVASLLAALDLAIEDAARTRRAAEREQKYRNRDDAMGAAGAYTDVKDRLAHILANYPEGN
jgi:hypothetical protein